MWDCVTDLTCPFCIYRNWYWLLAIGVQCVPDILEVLQGPVIVKVLSFLGTIHWSCLPALYRNTWSQIFWFLTMWWFSPNWPWWMRVAVQEVWMIRRCESVKVCQSGVNKNKEGQHQSSLIQCHSDWPELAHSVKSHLLSKTGWQMSVLGNVSTSWPVFNRVWEFRKVGIKS